MRKTFDRFDLLDAMNAADDDLLEASLAFFEEGKEPVPMKKPRPVIHTLLIAAALTLLLSATAFAAGLFSVKGRTVEPEETFPVSFETENGPIQGAWKGTYALEFDGPTECPAVRYRFGWVPEDYGIGEYVWSQADREGWIRRTGGDDGPGVAPWNAHTEFCGPARHDFFTTDMYYSAQFAPDGELILMSAEVLDVSEEKWGDLEVRKIVSSYGYLETDEEGAPVRDAAGEFVVAKRPCHYLVVFHPSEGWIFCVRGTLPMEDLEEIARNIEVEPSGETVHRQDFENPCAFFDAARG